MSGLVIFQVLPEEWRTYSDADIGRELLGVWPNRNSVIWLITSALFVLLIYGQIAKRAGFSRWISLLMLVPVIGTLLPLVFAFCPWPVERPARRKGSKKKGKR